MCTVRLVIYRSFTPRDGSLEHSKEAQKKLPAKAFQVHTSGQKSLLHNQGNVWRCVVTQAQLMSMMATADLQELIDHNNVIMDTPDSMEAQIGAWDRKRGCPVERHFKVGDRLRLHFFEANHPCEEMITRVGFATTLLPEFSEGGRNKLSREKLMSAAHDFRSGHAHSNVNHRVWTCHKQ